MSAKQTARKYLKMMTRGTLEFRILKSLIAGVALSQMTMYVCFGTTSGQQRTNELRRAGVPIQSRWKKTADGKRYKVYYL